MSDEVKKGGACWSGDSALDLSPRDAHPYVLPSPIGSRSWGRPMGKKTDTTMVPELCREKHDVDWGRCGRRVCWVQPRVDRWHVRGPSL